MTVAQGWAAALGSWSALVALGWILLDFDDESEDDS